MVVDYDDEDLAENEDYIKSAQEELKRVEHQVYVTLKYTRTVDVLLNLLERMISSYDELINALLFLKSDDENSFKNLSILEKVNSAKELYPDVQVEENLDIYLLLRKIVKAKNITKASEYRRPVNLSTIIDGNEIVIDIDIVTHYYAVIMSFYKYVELLYKNEELGVD
jgi:hypothetical protein